VSVRILIADDEPVARRRIRRLLKSQPDVAIVGEAGDGRAAVDAIQKLAPDLVFLDVQMPELDGFGVIAALGQRLPAMIFVTAFDEYALRAFEVHALDYLLKPFTRQRFDAAIERARRHLARRAPGLDARLAALLERLKADERYLTSVVVRAEGRIRLVPTAEIEWIKAADNYVVVRAGGQEHLLRETMDRLERELDPRRFARIHRSAIVRLDRVVELQPSFHGDFSVILRDGTRLTLSRTYRDRVAQVLRITSRD
jgi:two-component system LytT family response regulator